MRIVLYSRGETEEVEEALKKAGVDYGVYPETTSGDVAVSWGGDGTFLDCVRLLGHAMPVLGINSGRLGFLANVPMQEMTSAFEALKRGEYVVEERGLIEAAWDGIERGQAFNDFTITHGGMGMVSVEAFIDGRAVATYWGDGVIVSTPAGSTAYALSVGGPIIAPGTGCFLIAPIAPHNLTMRPIVVPDTCEIMLRMSTRDRYAWAALDNSRYEVGGGTAFVLRKADRRVRVVALTGSSFYETLRNKMLWGMDTRVMDN